MRYYDDPDEVSRRFRPRQVTPRPTFEERVTALERKVAEFSAILSGIAQQLIDVSSSVHDLTQLPGIYEHDKPAADDERVEQHSLRQPLRMKKTAYIIADSDDTRETERRLLDDVTLADRDL
jgi:hypothetical protein